jgi:hypothetical protein
MKPAEMKEIYQEACRMKRVTPSPDENRMWDKVLGHYEARDVKKALEMWWADTALGKDGRPKGSWMPAPAELRPVVDTAFNRRMRAASEQKDMVRWKCPDCGRFACGFVSHGFDGPPQICSGFGRETDLCGGVMDVIYHEGGRAQC